MDRFTNHGEVGADNKTLRFIRDAATLNSVSKDQLHGLYNIVYDRMAAYEDIGLEPDKLQICFMLQ